MTILSPYRRALTIFVIGTAVCLAEDSDAAETAQQPFKEALRKLDDLEKEKHIEQARAKLRQAHRIQTLDERIRRSPIGIVMAKHRKVKPVQTPESSLSSIPPEIAATPENVEPHAAKAPTPKPQPEPEAKPKPRGGTWWCRITDPETGSRYVVNRDGEEHFENAQVKPQSSSVITERSEMLGLISQGWNTAEPGPIAKPHSTPSEIWHRRGDPPKEVKRAVWSGVPVSEPDLPQGHGGTIDSSLLPPLVD